MICLLSYSFCFLVNYNCNASNSHFLQLLIRSVKYHTLSPSACDTFLPLNTLLIDFFSRFNTLSSFTTLCSSSFWNIFKKLYYIPDFNLLSFKEFLRHDQIYTHLLYVLAVGVQTVWRFHVENEFCILYHYTKQYIILFIFIFHELRFQSWFSLITRPRITPFLRLGNLHHFIPRTT